MKNLFIKYKIDDTKNTKKYIAFLNLIRLQYVINWKNAVCDDFKRVYLGSVVPDEVTIKIYSSWIKGEIIVSAKNILTQINWILFRCMAIFL